MGILDDVVVNAKSAAEAVTKRAGQLVDASKLRISAAEVSAEIGKRYEALGRYIYENCREALSADAEVVGKLAEIDELKAQHETISRELTDKSNRITCPCCGKQSPNTALFCSNCGTKLAEEAPVEEAPAEAPAEEKGEDEAE